MGTCVHLYNDVLIKQQQHVWDSSTKLTLQQAATLLYCQDITTFVLCYKTPSQEGDTAHPGLAKLVSQLDKVVDAGTKVTIPSLSVASLIPADAVLSEFFRYSGGLTTPTCNEIVQVMLSTLPFKTHQTLV